MDDEELMRWIENHLEILKMVKEHGNNNTVQSQAKSFLKIYENNKGGDSQ